MLAILLVLTIAGTMGFAATASGATMFICGSSVPYAFACDDQEVCVASPPYEFKINGLGTGGHVLWSQISGVSASISDPTDDTTEVTLYEFGSAAFEIMVYTPCDTARDTVVMTLTDCSIDEYCTLTQGAYGNAGGKYNGVGTLDLIESLLSSPLTVGLTSNNRSITIPLSAAECIIARLPAGGAAAALPVGLGNDELAWSSCQTSPAITLNNKGRWKNVLLGQTVALSLNTRWDSNLSDLELCAYINGNKIGQIVLDALLNLGLPNTVGGLLALANRGLGGASTGGASLSDINDAVSGINEGFDECQSLSSCSVTLSGENVFGSANGENLGNAIPAEYALQANYPNPFNPTTTINFNIPEASNVKLVVFSVLGQEVATLVDGVIGAGYREVEWNVTSESGNPLPSGVYLYRISASSITSERQFQAVNKMILMK